MSVGDLQEMAVVAGVHFLAVLSPGPDMAVVLGNTFARGRASGVATAVGIGVGKAVHVVALLSGLGVIVAGAPRFLFLAKVATGLYLAGLGLRGLFGRRRPATGAAPTAAARVPGSRGFLEGLVVSLINPKGFLFFFAVFAGMVPASGTSLMAVYLPLATGAIFVGIAVLATAGQSLLGAGPAARRTRSLLGTAMGLVLVALGFQLLRTTG